MNTLTKMNKCMHICSSYFFTIKFWSKMVEQIELIMCYADIQQ